MGQIDAHCNNTVYHIGTKQDGTFLYKYEETALSGLAWFGVSVSHEGLGTGGATQG